MLIAKLVGLLLLPPGIIVVVAVLGLLLRLRWPALGNALVLLAIAALVALSLPVTSHQLMASLEDDAKPLPASGWNAEAIIVLGGGRLVNAPEYHGDVVSAHTLERLRYAVRLHRATGLPLLVTGGAPFDEKTSEAELMRQALEQDFRVTPKWVEGQSRNTYENAAYSKAMLDAAGIRKALVVTHAWHMPRALSVFEQVGLTITAAPTAYISSDDERHFLDYVPQASALLLSSHALHEHLGLWWYKLRYPAGTSPIPNPTTPAPSVSS